jgi:small subunit ribosomal protein S4
VSTAAPSPPTLSEYLLQLQEKQKAKYIYGVLERQFRNLYEEASRQKGVTGENLLRCSSSASTTSCSAPAGPATRPQARQFVSHGMVHVNGAGGHPELPGAQGRRRLAARQVAPDDRDPAQPRHPRPPLRPGSRSATAARVTVRELPTREQIDVPVREQLIVELYSK